jgi:hypothetical protein
MKADLIQVSNYRLLGASCFYVKFYLKNHVFGNKKSEQILEYS